MTHELFKGGMSGIKIVIEIHLNRLSTYLEVHKGAAQRNDLRLSAFTVLCREPSNNRIRGDHVENIQPFDRAARDRVGSIIRLNTGDVRMSGAVRDDFAQPIAFHLRGSETANHRERGGRVTLNLGLEWLRNCAAES